jgi:hypothetical protein
VSSAPGSPNPEGTRPAGTRFEEWFRQLTPLVLLAVAFAILFEPWAERMVPGREWFHAQLGDHYVLRLCCAVLVFYVLLLWGECIRLHGSLTSLLKTFKDALGQRVAGDGERAARLDAVRMLIAALRSDDEAIRRKSRQNLARLVGEDLGDDPAAWQQWLDRGAGAGAGGGKGA